MAENFSPSGTSIATSTVGVIDDSNYIVYVGTTGNDQSGDGSKTKPYKTPHKALEHLRNFFITRNGFATIKCGAGRYTFSNTLEIRHPQGQRIGIRGQKTKDYILAKCSSWKSSHAENSLNRPSEITTSIRGTSACRYYEATVHLQELDWETSGNKLEPESASSKKGLGVENYATGDYALIRDHTFAHAHGYDTVHNDFGEDTGTNGQAVASSSFRNKNSSRRAPLIGAHPIKSNSREGGGAGDTTPLGFGFVKYDCKYYTFPHVTRFESTVGDDGDGVSWWGGFIGKESATAMDFDIPATSSGSGHMCSPEGRGDYFSNPYPDDASLGSNQTTNPVRFGNTAEGWFVPTSPGQEVSTTAFEGYKYNHTHGYELTIRKVRTSDTHHCTLNRMTLTHVRTIFEMKDIDKPCILIEGGELGFIQDLALEGGWQQFSKHMNDKSSAQYKMGASNHSGIDVIEGTLLYELGTTGDSSGINRFENADESGANMNSASVTTHNVGINGFKQGVKVRNSSTANLDDIAISNCRTGIHVESTSNIQVGVPYFAICYYNKGTDGITTGLSQKTFREGDSLVVNNTDENKFGIVSSWGIGPSGYPGAGYANIYDYVGNGIRNILPTKSDMQTNGLKLEHTGLTSDGVTPQTLRMVIWHYRLFMQAQFRVLLVRRDMAYMPMAPKLIVVQVLSLMLVGLR